ncbi:ATP-binding protein [Sphingobacterium kitahiroshimense]|uniref:ATP-binding protein n=1 Tax=Sphingobacterium kitahiroshimense TaxID=470446 RepID=A0ABV0C103_9SPHI
MTHSNENLIFEDSIPNPEYLIKSISEQGYTLESALADLIDNSISAKASNIEVLTDLEDARFKLFIADDGDGMTEAELIRNMKFPSALMEHNRDRVDLGRFGLGMKTASFSQTRKFTVLSKKKGNQYYHARTWDVEYLKLTEKWRVIVNTQEEVIEFYEKFKLLSGQYLNGIQNFEPNTIIIWDGLYKFEAYLSQENRLKAIKKEISEVTSDYLSLVFHRFLENKRNKLTIRLNNSILQPFSPFPENISDLRLLPSKQALFNNEAVRLEGYVLPVRSIDESKQVNSIWTTKFNSLLDLEGIYFYRANRIILFGGWNGLIRKSANLQLARLKVDLGNKIDHLIHLNVSKSQIKIPFELHKAFEDYISELKDEAQKEYFNRGIKQFSPSNLSVKKQDLFVRKATSKGALLEINDEFPLVNVLMNSLQGEDRGKLKLLLRMINTQMNKVRHVHEDQDLGNIEISISSEAEVLYNTINNLISDGVSKEIIKNSIIPNMGIKTNSLPSSILDLIR